MPPALAASSRPSVIRVLCLPAATHFLQAICICGKSSLEFLSVLENRKWANELEQFNVPKPGPAPVPNEGAAASAMYRAFEKAGCSKEFVRVYADVQERFKKQVAKLADGRLFMISIVLPELDAAARRAAFVTVSSPLQGPSHQIVGAVQRCTEAPPSSSRNGITQAPRQPHVPQVLLRPNR